jgi:hypothetical protein
MVSRTRKSLSYAGLVSVFIGIMVLLLLIGSPDIFSCDPQKIVNAIHQYHDFHGRWPNKLKQLKPQFLAAGVDLKSRFRTYNIHA